MATGYILVDAPNPYTAQGVYPRRGVRGKLTGTAILHTSEGNWQNGVEALTRLVRTRSDYGCYHQACDWVDIARYYPWEWETWQDTETNNWAVGIAAACKTTDWAVMPANIREGFLRNMARMAADFVTYMRTEYGVVVPLKRISGAEARAGVPGFCAHGDSGVHRSDPGVDFPWATFFKYTAEALKPTSTQKPTEAVVANLSRDEWREGAGVIHNTNIQEFGPDGKTKRGIKTFAYIIGNLNQWFSRVLESQKRIEAGQAEILALLKKETPNG